jgi:protein-L-isoaspartate(D-aspartate) O-methyltransferase
VTDTALLAAFRRVPRENFLPPAAKAIAYGDLEPEVAPGRCLMRPRDLAKLIQALAPAPNEKALEIAGATAYGAAVLAGCVREVVSLDPNPDLSFAASAALEQSGVRGVTAVSTEVAAGWPDGAPYDIIMLNGGADFVPDAWLEQLKDGGRLGVIVRNGAAGQARIYLKSGGASAYRVAFDAAPPLAPAMTKPRTFAF